MKLMVVNSPQALLNRQPTLGLQNTPRGASLITHLITVGVISAQKNTLRLPTAWEANMPTMENAMENLSLTLSLIPEGQSEGDGEEKQREGKRKLARPRQKEQGEWGGGRPGNTQRSSLFPPPQFEVQTGCSVPSVCGGSPLGVGGQTFLAMDLAHVPAGPCGS